MYGFSPLLTVNIKQCVVYTIYYTVAEKLSYETNRLSDRQTGTSKPYWILGQKCSFIKVGKGEFQQFNNGCQKTSHFSKQFLPHLGRGPSKAGKARKRRMGKEGKWCGGGGEFASCIDTPSDVQHESANFTPGMVWNLFFKYCKILSDILHAF